MPSAYQTFKKEHFDDVKVKYFTDYELKTGESFNSLVSSKCKDLWESLTDSVKDIYTVLSKVNWVKGYIKGNSDAGVKRFKSFQEAYEYHNTNSTSATGITRHLEKDKIIFELRGGKKGQYKEILESLDDQKEHFSFLFEIENNDSIIETNNDKTINELSIDSVNQDDTSPLFKSQPPSYEESENITPATPTTSTTVKKDSLKRKSIPKAVKVSIWKKYISPSKLDGKCFVGCGTLIQINNFEAGHVISFSNGGENTIENLRPICSLCNKSMGKTNMNEFIDKYKFKSSDDISLKIKENETCLEKNSKNITKLNKKNCSQNNKQDKLEAEISKIQAELIELQAKLTSKKEEFKKNQDLIEETCNQINEAEQDKNKLLENSKFLKSKQELEIRNKIIEEQKIKKQIREEILLEQKKEKLRLEVLKEMGITAK